MRTRDMHYDGDILYAPLLNIPKFLCTLKFVNTVVTSKTFQKLLIYWICCNFYDCTAASHTTLSSYNLSET